MDIIAMNFWWINKPDNKKGIPLKNWKDIYICLPKEVGGLGFQKFQDKNVALIAKLEWFLFTN